jgi:O-antigen/teichoic acid export membrane protein
MKDMIRYASSFLLISAFTAIVMYSDRWIILGSLGEAEVGSYVAIYQVASAPLMLLFGLISQFMVPIIYQRAGSMETREQVSRSAGLIRMTVGIAILATGPFVVLAMLAGKDIMTLVTTPKVAEQSGILWVLMVAIMMTRIADLLALEGFNRRRPGVYVLPRAAQAGVFLVMALVWVDDHALAGVVNALILASAIYMLAVMHTNRRLRRAEPA